MGKIHLPESQNVECKESWRDEYLKWICGFANANGGYIYVGVEDGTHNIVGIKDSKRLLEDIPNKIVTNLGIIADVNLHQVDGLDYLEIVIINQVMFLFLIKEDIIIVPGVPNRN